MTAWVILLTVLLGWFVCSLVVTGLWSLAATALRRTDPALTDSADRSNFS